MRKCSSQNQFLKTKKEWNMVTNKNDFMVTFFVILGIFAINACTSVRYKSRPALEPVPVAGPAPIAEAKPEPIVEAGSEPAPPALPVALPVAEQAAEPERIPLTVQSYINVERLKGKPKGLIVVPSEGWVNEANEIAYKGNHKIYLLKKKGASFEPVKITFEAKDINYGALVIELEPGEYKIDKIDTNLFNIKCNCYEEYSLRFNNTNFKVENEIARITPYALTTLTYTDNPKINKTFLSHPNNTFKYNIRWYLENLFLKKGYNKNWKIM